MSASVLWRRLAGALVAAFGALALRWASVVDVPTAHGQMAALRLSWSARPERIEQCRRLSDEELAALPAHMRLRFECTGTFARYLLIVSLDNRVVIADTIRGSGLRHDRPMHLFQEVRVNPGRRRVGITMSRIDSVSGTATAETVGGPSDSLLGDRAARERDERRRRAAEAIPAVLALDTALTLQNQQVVLVTYDGQARQLVVRTRTP